MANGSLSLSKCIEVIVPTFYDSMEAGKGCDVHHSMKNIEKQQKINVLRDRNTRQILLTTCVGSTEELEQMVLTASALFQQVWKDIPLSPNQFKGMYVKYTGGVTNGRLLHYYWICELA